VVDFNALMAQRKAGNYDLASAPAAQQRPARWRGDFSTEAKESGYNNPQVDKLINEGNAVLDVEKRKPIYHQLYQVLAEDPPVILLGYREFSRPAAPGYRL
jgi:peptide/nickel transport system substrate-binding protein